MHADKPPASSWPLGTISCPLGTIIRVKTTAPKFPSHRFPCSQCLLLVVCWACSLVRAFPASSLSPRSRTLAGCLACALSCLFRGQQQLPFLLGHQQPTNATGSVCSLFSSCFSLSAHYDYITRIRTLTSSLLFRLERKVSSFPLFLFVICCYSLFYFWFLFSYSVRATLWVRECVCVCVFFFFFRGVCLCGACYGKQQ